MVKIILKGEKEAIKKVLDIAEEWGYGNLISVLEVTWALKTLKEFPSITIKTINLKSDILTALEKLNREDAIKSMEAYLER